MSDIKECYICAGTVVNHIVISGMLICLQCETLHLPKRARKVPPPESEEAIVLEPEVIGDEEEKVPDLSWDDSELDTLPFGMAPWTGAGDDD